jgi:hypothetical protein
LFVRVVVALGGNALIRRGQRPDLVVQRENIRTAAVSIAALAAVHDVVLTHGNGPQIGLLALESSNDPDLTSPYPLDVLGAETDGMIGYLLEQELQNLLPGRRVVTVLTQTVVDATPRSAGPRSRSARSTTRRPPGVSPPSEAGSSARTATTGAGWWPPPSRRPSSSCRRSRSSRGATSS